MNRSCPKCGHYNLSLLYHADGETVSLYRKIQDHTLLTIMETDDKEFRWLVASREFLSVHCRTCQYYWEELPLDMKDRIDE